MCLVYICSTVKQSFISIPLTNHAYHCFPGELSTLDTLDRTVQATYNLTVQATDSRTGSWSSTGCSIGVTDVNDHRPMFGQPMYIANVYENATKGHIVQTLQAFDEDLGTNALISYKLSSDDKKALFKIDQNSGKNAYFRFEKT